MSSMSTKKAMFLYLLSSSSLRVKIILIMIAISTTIQNLVFLCLNKNKLQLFQHKNTITGTKNVILLGSSQTHNY